MSSLFPIARQGRSYNSMLNDIDSVFNSFFHSPSTRNIVKNNPSLVSTPRANVVKIDAGYTLELACPGLTRDEIDIQLEEGVLTISHNSQDTVEYTDACTVQEYSYSDFTRSWTLPKTTQIEKIEAAYEAGILKVTIPTEAEQRKMRTIEVL